MPLKTMLDYISGFGLAETLLERTDGLPNELVSGCFLVLQLPKCAPSLLKNSTIQLRWGVHYTVFA